jgi:two-component system alkaline phosphatase synthesis response regulator PhoP/two-component system response regulator VicR
VSHAQESMSRRIKILICDDEPFVLRLLQVHFERNHFDVITATDGREALTQIDEHQPDICLLDVMMPYISGLEVLTKIRNNAETADLPVVLLTVKAQDDDVYEAFHRGATMYLTKPFDPEYIVQTVQLILQHSS